jgi:ferredoxin
MKKTIHLIYFSPTKTTEKVLKSISEGIQSKENKLFDFTFNTQKEGFYSVPENELAIIGVPVYSGRVPLEAMKRLKKQKGNNTPAVIVVVYGNREFDDALLELRDLVIELGFIPFAAAAFIGEHSYSTTEKQIAPNRPDEEDLRKAFDFGKQINELIEKGNIHHSVSTVPGNIPYKAFVAKPPMSPITIETKCDKCGICAEVCPTSAIEINDTVETDINSCIMCCACIKACPTEARVNDNELIKAVTQRLFENCQMRKEPELFLE